MKQNQLCSFYIADLHRLFLQFSHDVALIILTPDDGGLVVEYGTQNREVRGLNSKGANLWS